MLTGRIFGRGFDSRHLHQNELDCCSYLCFLATPATDFTRYSGGSDSPDVWTCLRRGSQPHRCRTSRCITNVQRPISVNGDHGVGDSLVSATEFDRVRCCTHKMLIGGIVAGEFTQGVAELRKCVGR